jgi:hypothetical protein
VYDFDEEVNFANDSLNVLLGVSGEIVMFTVPIIIVIISVVPEFE